MRNVEDAEASRCLHVRVEPPRTRPVQSNLKLGGPSDRLMMAARRGSDGKGAGAGLLWPVGSPGLGGPSSGWQVGLGRWPAGDGCVGPVTGRQSPGHGCS